MAYPADAFGGGVQGVWFDSQVIGNHERDNVVLVDYNGVDGRFFDEWNDKSGNGNDLVSLQIEWDGKAYNVGGFKYAWFWHPLEHAQGASTTGMYFAVAHQAAHPTQYYSKLFSDVNAETTGFRLEYSGDGDAHGKSNSVYIFSAGNGSTRVKCVISAGTPLYSFETGKKLIECWWTSALGLNIRINKGPVTTVACGSVSAGLSVITFPHEGIFDVHNYLYTKNTALDTTGRNAIADSFGASAGITLESSGFPPITGSVHARETQVDDRTLALGANARNGFASISESPVRDTFRALSATFVGGRQGSAAIAESGGSDRFLAVRQVPDVPDDAFIAWLKSDSKIFTILVDAEVNIMSSPGGGEFTRNLSNTGYTTGAADSPANVHYEAVVSAGGVISEVLPIDGSASMAFGDIEIDNTDGVRDSWLDDIWRGRRCRVYVGDQRWAKASFRLIFDGIANDNLVSRARGVLNLTLHDKLQKINTMVSDTKLGGTSANADRNLPITIGECHNVTPLLIDRSTLNYQFHHATGGWNNAERVLEVRDNGIPVPSTPDNPGTFKLTFSPVGAVTASVQGDAQPYANTISRSIQRLVKNCSNTPLVDADLDIFNLNVFDAANPQPIGMYLSDATNVLAACQELAGSVGGQLVMTATGLLRLLKIQLPAIFTPTAVNLAHIIEGTLEIAQRPPVVAAVKIGYCRNWTPQPNLQTALPAEHKDLYAQEWLTATAKDDSVAFNHKLTKDPDQVNTMLITKADADAEALRRLNLWKVQRTVFRYQGTAELLVEQLGGYQTLTNRRFGLAAGKTGQIVGIQRDWMTGRVVIELLV